MQYIMTNREFFAATIKDELPRFERVFKAIPAKKLDHTPHPKSRTAIDLIAVLANESGFFIPFMETGVIDFAKIAYKKFKSPSDASKTFTANMKKISGKTAKMTEVQWNLPAKMLMGGKVEWEATRGNMAWSFLFDAIHHRGQLSTYIRPMGGKVPSIYGPSGDSK